MEKQVCFLHLFLLYSIVILAVTIELEKLNSSTYGLFLRCSASSRNRHFPSGRYELRINFTNNYSFFIDNHCAKTIDLVFLILFTESCYIIFYIYNAVLIYFSEKMIHPFFQVFFMFIIKHFYLDHGKDSSCFYLSLPDFYIFILFRIPIPLANASYRLPLRLSYIPSPAENKPHFRS